MFGVSPLIGQCLIKIGKQATLMLHFIKCKNKYKSYHSSTIIESVPCVSSGSPRISRKPAPRALFGAFFTTKSLKPAFRLGCLSTSSRSWSFGSCSSALKLAGAIALAHRMKPSHKGGFIQIFFVIKRDSNVVETNPTSDL